MVFGALEKQISDLSVNYLMIRRGIIGAVVLGSLVGGGFQSAHAQNWQVLSTPISLTSNTPGFGNEVIPYFLNSNFGFIYADTGWFFGCIPGIARIYSTTDGGISWRPVLQFCGKPYGIKQLSFTSLTHGFILVDTELYDTQSNLTLFGEVFETFDGGNSWQRITPTWMTAHSVYATQGAVFVTADRKPPFLPGGYWLYAQGSFPTADTGAIFRTSNDGKSWDSVAVQVPLPKGSFLAISEIVGNRDSLVLVLAYDTLTQTYIIYSTDLGLSWQTEPLERDYVWPTLQSQNFRLAAYCIPHTCEVIRVFDGSLQDQEDKYTLFKGTLPFNLGSWYPLLSAEIGAWIAGNGCAQYVSNAFDGHPTWDGLIRWEENDTARINGPQLQEIDDQEYRNISAVGYGSVLYVGTSYLASEPGQLWKTTDGGDGTLSATSLAPRIEWNHAAFASGNDTLTIIQCSSSPSSVYYQNLSCAITKMDSVSLIGLAQNEYSLTSTHHNDCLSLPDSTYINFVSIPPGTYPVSVNAHFTDDEYNTIDTTLSFTLVVQPGNQPIPLSLYFKSSSITTAAGDTLEIPVYLSGNATLDSTFLTLPFGIDTNVLHPIGFHSAISGITAGSITYSGGTGTVPLQFSDLTLNGETLIGYLRCVVYLADTLATTVMLQIPSLTSANTPCTALSLTTDSVNILINGCGDKTLLQFMKTGTISLAIQSIVPNPSSDEITVLGVGLSQATIDVYDVLGRLTTPQPPPIPLHSIGGGVAFDVSCLPNGLYYVRARNAATGMIASGKFVIER